MVLFIAGDALETISLMSSRIVGPAFEGDVEAMLPGVMRRTCPFAAGIELVGERKWSSRADRPVEDQVDIFGYIEGPDFLGLPCREQPLDGAVLVHVRPEAALDPTNCALPALTPSEGSSRRFSEGGQSKDMPQKYLLGEVYSGRKHDKRVAKIKQLEEALSFALRRWQDLNPGIVVSDITQIVGVAVFAFAAEPVEGMRQDIATSFMQSACNSNMSTSVCHATAKSNAPTSPRARTRAYRYPEPISLKQCNQNICCIYIFPRGVTAVTSASDVTGCDTGT